MNYGFSEAQNQTVHWIKIFIFSSGGRHALSVWHYTIQISATKHSTIVLYMHIRLPKKTASNIPLITAKNITAATAKIKGILLKAASKVTWASRAALSVVFRRSSEHVS